MQRVTVMNYDRRAATVKPLESILFEWFRQASQFFVSTMLTSAGVDRRKMRLHTAPQFNGVQIDVESSLAWDPAVSGIPDMRVEVEIHIEWFLGPADFDIEATVTFEGGGKAHKQFRPNMKEDPARIGAEVGAWIASIEPVAPTEA